MQSPVYLRPFPVGLQKDDAHSLLAEFMSRYVEENNSIFDFKRQTKIDLAANPRNIDLVALYLLRLLYIMNGVEEVEKKSPERSTLADFESSLERQFGKNIVLYTREVAYRRRDADLRRHFFLRNVLFNLIPMYDPITAFVVYAHEEKGETVYEESGTLALLKDALGVPAKTPVIKIRDTGYILVSLKAFVDERINLGQKLLVPLHNGVLYTPTTDELAYIDTEYGVQIEGKARKPEKKGKKKK